MPASTEHDTIPHEDNASVDGVDSPRPTSPSGDNDNDNDPSTASAAKKRKSTALPELEVDLSLPEPPSKRAKRALKKGKPLPTKPKSDDGNDDDDDGGDKDKKSKKDKEPVFGVWIGNLPFTVTRPQLFQWLIDSSGGVITDELIKRVNLPAPNKRKNNNSQYERRPREDLPPPQNKGFAYADFATYEAQVAAIALSETELHGRRLLIKDSKSYEGRPSAAERREGARDGDNKDDDDSNDKHADASLPANTATKIFVGNLGFDTTEEDLRRHFAPCGTVAWAKVATFPDNTEKCRGYGWVQFAGASSDNAAVEAAAAAAAAVKGFVRIKEVVETEDDFVAEAEGQEEGGQEEEQEEQHEQNEEKKPAGRTKMRKWWVNMLKGRQLKVQFAEDDKVRYKKRFGKDRPTKGGDGASSERRQPYRRRDNENNNATASSGEAFKFQDPSIAYRTGAMAAPTGKKTVFE